MASRTARPRTFADAKRVSSSNAELAWWVFMRVSGLLLIFFVLVHIWANNIATNVGEIDYDYVAERLAQPSVRVFDTFLLFFAMLHGVNGLRYSIEDYVRLPQRRFWYKVILFTVAGGILVLGAMALWTFSFEEMGAAVRALGEPTR